MLGAGTRRRVSPCLPHAPLTTAVCVPGYGKVGAASRCDICPVNTFSPGGNATNQMPPCTACPAGSTAATPGATACQTGERVLWQTRRPPPQPARAPRAGCAPGTLASIDWKPAPQPLAVGWPSRLPLHHTSKQPSGASLTAPCLRGPAHRRHLLYRPPRSPPALRRLHFQQPCVRRAAGLRPDRAGRQQDRRLLPRVHGVPRVPPRLRVRGHGGGPCVPRRAAVVHQEDHVRPGVRRGRVLRAWGRLGTVPCPVCECPPRAQVQAEGGHAP